VRACPWVRAAASLWEQGHSSEWSDGVCPVAALLAPWWPRSPRWPGCSAAFELALGRCAPAFMALTASARVPIGHLHLWRLLLQRACQLDTCIYGAYCFSARVPVAHAPPIPQAEALTKVDADWMVNGKFGMIQFTKG